MSFTIGQTLKASDLNNAINTCVQAGNVSAYSQTLLNQTTAAAWISTLGITSTSNLGQPNGIATLDGTGHLTSTQIPSIIPGNISIKGPLPWIDVIGYGAVGDGATDNLSAINNAISAVPAAGGVLYFPPGTYNVSNTITLALSNVKIFGAGAGASTIQGTSATADIVVFGGGGSYSNCTISDISVGTNATRTAGNHIKFSNVTGGAVGRVSIINPFTGIYLTGSSYIFISDAAISNAVATGQGIIVNTGNNYYFDRVAVYTVTTQCTYGMNIQACDSAFIDNCHFINTGYGIYANPSSAVTVQKTSVANSAATGCTNDGFYLNPGSGGNVYNFRIEGSRSASNSGNGINIGASGTIKGINIVGTSCIDNNGHGVNVQGGTYVMIDCCHIGGNSAASSGTNSGVNVAAGVSSFDIRNNRIGLSPASGSATQKYGINIATGSSNNYAIVGNDVNDNVTQGLNDGGSGATKQTIGNLPATNETKSVIGGTVTLSAYGAGVVQTNASGVVSVSASTTTVSGVRQTVLTSPVTSSGTPNFLPSTSGSLSLTTQNLTSSNPLVVSSANGYNANGANDSVGIATSNFTWSSLTANSTVYLYVTVSGGALTPGFTTASFASYIFGGSIPVTNGIFTFDFSQMIGYLGNGTTAPQANIVFVGECVTGASTVTSTKAYALRGYFDSGLTNTLPGASTGITFNHNLGAFPRERPQLYFKCITTDNSYAVGDFIQDISLDPSVAGACGPITIRMDRMTGSFYTANADAAQAVPKGGGQTAALTDANWAYGMTFKRGW